MRGGLWFLYGSASYGWLCPLAKLRRSNAIRSGVGRGVLGTLRLLHVVSDTRPLVAYVRWRADVAAWTCSSVVGTPGPSPVEKFTFARLKGFTPRDGKS